MRRFSASKASFCSLWAAVPFLALAVGCGIDAESVPSPGASAGGRPSGGGRGGAAGVGVGKGGGETIAGAGGSAGAGLGGSGPVAGQGGAGAAGKGGAGLGGAGGSAGNAGTNPGKGGVGGTAGTAGASGGAGGDAGSSSGAAGGGGDPGDGGSSGAGGAGNAGGTGGSAGAPGGSGGAAGSGGLGGAGAGAGSGGSAGDGGTAGASGTAGVGGIAGAAGSAGAAGNAGAAGSGGAAGQGPILCGNGHLDAGETCDDGSGPTGSAACKACQVPCEPGGLLDNGRCYFRSDALPGEKGTIAGDVRAQQKGQPYTLCNAQGAHLASLGGPTEDSSAFLDKLGAHFGTTTTKQLLVGVLLESDGVVSSDDPADWIWLDGTVPSSGRWDGSNPDADGDDAQCGTLMNKRLNDLPCGDDALQGLLCEREPRCAVRSPNNAPPYVGYLSPDQHCWVALPTKVSWVDALAACTALKFLDGTGTGTIAVFDTPKRLAELPGVGMFESWVGALQADNGVEDSDGKRRAGWTWLTGPNAYAGNVAMWEPGKPNDASANSTEDYASLTTNRQLDDDELLDQKRPLCEVTP